MITWQAYFTCKPFKVGHINTHILAEILFLNKTQPGYYNGYQRQKYNESINMSTLENI